MQVLCWCTWCACAGLWACWPTCCPRTATCPWAWWASPPPPPALSQASPSITTTSQYGYSGSGTSGFFPTSKSVLHLYTISICPLGKSLNCRQFRDQCDSEVVFEISQNYKYAVWSLKRGGGGVGLLCLAMSANGGTWVPVLCTLNSLIEFLHKTAIPWNRRPKAT